MSRKRGKRGRQSEQAKSSGTRHEGGEPRGDQSRRESQPSGDQSRRESGMPGGGQGRRDEVGGSGVYPMSGGIPEGHHPEIRTMAAWGQGERGAEGYNDAGGSELVWRDGQLLGGLTAGPGGEPTIDIHGGDRPPQQGTPTEKSEPEGPKKGEVKTGDGG